MIPIGGAMAGVVVLGLSVRRLDWARGAGRAGAAGGPALDPELERRIDEELERFDGLRSCRSRSSPGSSPS